MAKAILIDGYSFLFRAYYAMPALTDSQGRPTGAVQGFLNMLLRLITDQQPDLLGVVVDVAGKTFRHEAYEDYKANRSETPEDFLPQAPLTYEVLEALGIPVIGVPGFEADDVLAALAQRLEARGDKVYLASADRDLFQLVTDNIHLLVPRRGVTDIEDWDEARFRREEGFDPRLVPDYKALSGDASDNIKGVAGIGPKTATRLIQDFGSVEELLARIEEVNPPKLREKLREGAEGIRRDKQLATLAPDFALDFDLTELERGAPDLPALRMKLAELNFRQLAERFEQLFGGAGEPALPTVKLASSLAEAPLPSKGSVALATLPSGTRFALAWQEEEVWLVGSEEDNNEAPLEGLFAEAKPEYSAGLELLAALLASPLELVVFDAKHLLTQVEAPLDVTLGELFDTRLAAYLINPDQAPQTLEALANSQLGLKLEATEEETRQLRESLGKPLAPAEVTAIKAAWALVKLAPSLKTALNDLGLEPVMRELELPLVPILYKMERTGFAVDKQELARIGQELAALLAQVEQQAYELVGETFNLGSPKQLQEVLFEKLGLPKTRRTKTGFSTDAAELERLLDAHPIIPLLLDWRNWSKLKSTYADALLALAEHSSDGRIHTTLNQTIAATGRLSSTEPNLQNIPQGVGWGTEIRRCFVPGKPDWVLLSGDYSQIELRVLAHLSKEPRLIEAFQKGEDIHRHTAAEVFGVPQEAVTSEQRDKAKMINFGLVYGMTEYGYASRLRIPVDEAQAYIAQYMARLPKVGEYIARTIEEARATGKVATLFGRIRFMPELASANQQVRRAAERRAINMPVQGTAADIMKFAMIRVADRMRGDNSPAKLLLQVHDELVLEVPRQYASETAALLRSAMEDVVPLVVPLTVSLKVGPNWADQVPID